MKKNYLKLIAIVSLAAVAFGCGNNTETSRTEIASPVSVEEVTPRSIDKLINTTGTVRAAYEVALSSEMAGTYKLQTNPATGRPFKLGDKVSKGQIIIKLEDKEYENSIAIESKKINLELLKQEQAAQESIYEIGGATGIDLRRTELNVANAETDYESAQIRLDKMNIVAPFTGTIVDLPYYTPDAIIPSGSSMASIMDYTRMFMEINMPESVINDIHANQKVNVTHYTLPYDTIPGAITEISPAISTETRTFKGNLNVDNSRLLLRPGMFVKADIVVDKAENTIVVPKNVVISNRRRKYVFVVERNMAIMRDVQTGIEDEDNVQIISGLEFGDNLVVRGQETLRENSQVKIQR